MRPVHPLAPELARVGYKGTEMEFYEIVMGTFAAFLRSTSGKLARTDEEMLLRPRLALGFCNNVRKRASVVIDDHHILRALIATRKRKMRPDSMKVRQP